MAMLVQWLRLMVRAGRKGSIVEIECDTHLAIFSETAEALATIIYLIVAKG